MPLPYEEDSPPPPPSDGGSGSGSGAGSPGSSGAGAVPTSNSYVSSTVGSLGITSRFSLLDPSKIGNTTGGILGSVQRLIANIIAPKPQATPEPEEEKKPEAVAPVVPPSYDPTPKIPTWVWYVGFALLGLAIVGSVLLWFRNGKS